MPTTWTIAIDWERNGNYTGTYDDVTDRMISAEWFLGMRQPYQDIADDSKLTLKLSNHDRRFSPEYSSSPLYGDLAPFRPVRIQSNDGATTRTHWVGWVESISPAVNKNGERTVTISASGPMQFLKAAETTIELQSAPTRSSNCCCVRSCCRRRAAAWSGCWVCRASWNSARRPFSAGRRQATAIWKKAN